MKKIVLISLLLAVSMSGSSVLACTGFTASNESQVLVGNNEDSTLLIDPQLRIYAPTSTNFGRVMLYCKWPYPFDTAPYCAFGGMNDQGLFFDIYSTPYLESTNPDDKPTYNQDIFEYCMRKCTTVNEVVDVFSSYYIPYLDNLQGFFADKTGDSIIIEGDEYIYKSGDFQVVTNFLQTHPELGWYPCWRFNLATSMLENMTDLSVDYFKQICNATHEENIVAPEGFKVDTIYSYICDLTQGKMYLYFLHDYDNVFEIHLPDIFEDGNQVIDLPSLFADNSTHPPNKPIITDGPGSGRINTQYECSSIGSDDDNDGLFYYFDYGDGSNSGWIGHYNSGEECTVTHSWAQQGNYEIKVKTKDIFGFESDWSEPLQISMPKYKISSLFEFNDTYTDFPSVVTFILMLLAGFK